jgi:hypothetical protein
LMNGGQCDNEMISMSPLRQSLTVCQFIVFFSHPRRPPIQHATPEVSGERCLAWLIRNGRLAKDYERTVQTSEILTELAAIRFFLCRPARPA